MAKTTDDKTKKDTKSEEKKESVGVKKSEKPLMKRKTVMTSDGKMPVRSK